MSEFIVQSRITARKAPANIISRRRLLEKFQLNRNKNLFVIESPAGYGKTTLVQDFISKSDVKHAWFHVAEDIDSFYSFMTYIVHSLKMLNKDFGSGTLEVIESMKQSMQLPKDLQVISAAVTGTFINEFLKEFITDIYLVLDDLHKARDPEWLTVLFNNLAEDFPEKLHVVITTRTAPKFDLTKFSSKRNLLLLDSKDLRFDTEETAALIEKVYSLKYDKKDMDLFEKNISGWITGIHLILQAYGKDYNKIKFEHYALPKNIFDFFANDVFNKLDVETQSFLVNTAYLENFTSEICDWLLGINKSMDTINNLLKKNIFIEASSYKTDDSAKEKQSYNYNGLFKKYLLAKMKELKTDEEILNLVRNIFEFSRKAGDYSSAIRYSLICQDFESAVELIIKQFPVLFEEVRLNTLWDWITSLPEEYFTSRGILKYYKGKLLKYLKADMVGAFDCLNESLNSSEITSDERMLTECSVQLAEILMITGKPAEALVNLNNILEKVNEPENKAVIYYWIAGVNYRLGPQKYDEVIRILNICLEICGKHGIKPVQTDVNNLLGNIYQDKGEFVKSSLYYEIVVKNERNIFKKFLALSNIILVKSSSGEYEKAKKYLDDEAELYDAHPSVLFERYLLRTAAYFRFECGDYEESLKLYEKLLEIETKSNTPQFKFWYYLLMGEASIFLGRAENALQLYELAGSCIDPDDEYERLELELHKAILEKKSSINDSIEKKFFEFHKYYEENEYVYSKTQIEFHIADFFFKKGNISTALRFLDSSLKVSSGKQYISFHEQNFADCRYLYDLAITGGISKNFIINLRQGLSDKLSYDWLSPECRKRIERSRDELYDIKMNLFGGIEIIVRGKRVNEEIWIRKKSKLILVYLMLNQTMKFTKDKMMDMFFRELTVESAENIFHQAVTNIRNAVKPYDINSILYSEKKVKSKTLKSKAGKEGAAGLSDPLFVIYEDKILRLNPDYYYKVDVVDFNRLYNKVKSSESDTEAKELSAKQALELYRGEFLPGYYESWCEDIRENLINKYVDLSGEIINIYKQKNMPFEKGFYAEKLLEVDNLNEKAYIDLIESYAETGNISAARNKFSQMLKIFDEEFGEKPSLPTLEKIKNILLKFDSSVL